MFQELKGHVAVVVALHPEGVDRNIANETISIIENASPSTRRAWIEI